MTLIPNARRSLSYLRECTDPGRSWIPYFMGFWHEDGMELRHSPWDIVENTGRAAYAQVLNQRILGDGGEPEVAAAWKRHLASVWSPELELYAVPDGLDFLPTDPAAQASLGVYRSKDYAVASLWENKAVYLGLVLGGLAWGDQERIDLGRRVLQGARRWLVRDPGRGWAYATHPHISRETREAKDAPPVAGQEMSGLIQMLVLDWRSFREQGSLDLALQIAECMLATVPEPGRRWPRYHNVHSFLFYLTGLAQLYHATGEKRYLDYAARWHDWVTETLATSWGWISEFPPQELHPHGSCKRERGDHPTGEICATSDAVAAAVSLARALGGKYWSVAERFTRNFLAAAQVDDITPLPLGVRGPESEHASFRDVPARLRGIYGGWTAPNDIVDFRGRNRRRVFQSCCGTHAVWGLHAAWEAALTQEPGVVSANLRLDRETPFARALYTEPEGTVEIQMKVDSALRVRLPAGTAPGTLRARVDGAEVPTRMVDGFAHVGPLRAGATVLLRYLCADREDTEVVPIRGETYQTQWSGETLLSLTPRGGLLPILNDRAWSPPDPGAVG